MEPKIDIKSSLAAGQAAAEGEGRKQGRKGMRLREGGREGGRAAAENSHSITLTVEAVTCLLDESLAHCIFVVNHSMSRNHQSNFNSFILKKIS